MLGLHNILLISPPSSSQHNHPPIPSTTTSSVNPHHDHNNNSTRNIHHHHHHKYSNNDHEDDDDGDADGDGDVDGDGSLKVCRDCGNRAKKECSFRRCRTCCKTRGFDCATHIRSTWVPASRRREKKIGSVGGGASGSGSGSCSSYGVKRPRLFLPSPSSQNATTPTTSSFSANDLSLGISSHPQDSNFKKSLPGRVEARAVFRNIRVTDISDGEAENAYVATVNISGHVFKGLLYDHGSGQKSVFPCLTKLQMDTSNSKRYRDSSSPSVDPSNTYTAASGN